MKQEKKQARHEAAANKAAGGKKLKPGAVAAIAVAAVVVVGVAAALALRGGKPATAGSSSGSGETGFHELQEEEDPNSIVPEVKPSEDFVEPGEGTLDLSGMQGLTVPERGGSVTVGSQPTEGSGGIQAEPAGPSGPVLADPLLTVEAIGKYTGNFLEDGSDTPIQNVTAMVITNNSDQMLQVGLVTFQVNESETAEFKVTDLPAGTSTMVLEANRRIYNEADDFSYGEVSTAYIDQPSLESDKFDILQEDGKLTLVNKTGTAYSMVYVYYKYVQLGGAYLGGITYRVPFENVPANGQLESVAGHFNPESSRILAVQAFE